MKLDTTIYKNGRVARNARTGEYYNRQEAAFCTSLRFATILSASEFAVVRASFDNVQEELVATLIDEVAAACNRTGVVGYYYDVQGPNPGRAEFIISVEPVVRVTALQLCTGRILLRRMVDGRQTGFRLVANVDEVPPVLQEWKK